MRKYRYRPAVRAHSSEQLPFHVDWRSGGLAGISTNDEEYAEVWRQARLGEGRIVVEWDAESRQNRPPRAPLHNELARDIVNGRREFSSIECSVIVEALRAYRRPKPKRRPTLPPRLLYTANEVRKGTLRLDLCPIFPFEKVMIRKYLRATSKR